MKTYRYTGHSVSDAGLYRSKEEVEANKQRDPILATSRELVETKVLTEEELKSLQKKTKALIQEAVDFADESPEPPVEELTQHVYFDEIG
jgi:pyruvate dehydrogenase E1 component alpha subunit